jgi:hypothetical protein
MNSSNLVVSTTERSALDCAWLFPDHLLQMDHCEIVSMGAQRELCISLIENRNSLGL